MTMSEILASVKRVTGIMAHITSASHEQTAGIEQINLAISQMDKVTHQNAVLVEQAALAASSMQEQTNNLVSVVSVFKLDMLHSTVADMVTTSRPRMGTSKKKRSDTIHVDKNFVPLA